MKILKYQKIEINELTNKLNLLNAHHKTSNLKESFFRENFYIKRDDSQLEKNDFTKEFFLAQLYIFFFLNISKFVFGKHHIRLGKRRVLKLMMKFHS